MKRNKLSNLIDLLNFLETDQYEEFIGFIHLTCISNRNNINVPHIDSKQDATKTFENIYTDIDYHIAILIQDEDYEMCARLMTLKKLLLEAFRYTLAYLIYKEQAEAFKQQKKNNKKNDNDGE